VFKEVRGRAGRGVGLQQRPGKAAHLRAGLHRPHRLQRGGQAGAYDPAQISLREILEIFFVVHDPTTLNRQGNDVGTQYRSGIYFTTPEQQQVAQDLIREINQDKHRWRAGGDRGEPLANYFAAEDYHQDFFENNPTRATAWPWRRPRWPSSARLEAWTVLDAGLGVFAGMTGPCNHEES
jgi:hypothetical protein